jgi:Capsule assembly protein Wzi
MRVFYLFLLLSATCCFGQRGPKPLRYRTEVGSYFSTAGLIPFWMRANQYGIVPREHAIMTLRQNLRVDYHDAPRTKLDSLRAKNRRVDWGWGVDAVLNAGYDYKVVIPEAYVKVKIGVIETWAGRRREVVGLVDSTLSSGSYAWSGNALPMLKIQAGIPEYWPRRSVFAIRGFYAQGWFEADRFIQNTMLHQKALYVRFGKPNWKIKLYGGMNHQVMWGGTPSITVPGVLTAGRPLPNTLSDYVDVVTAKSLGTRNEVDTSRITIFDRENRIGNHLGTVDVAFEWTNRKFSVFAYRQSIYETGSLYYLTNIRDGLAGIRIRTRKPINPNGFQIREFLVEQLYTLSQGGPEFTNDPQRRGKNNYFNHSQYRDGWSRYDMTIGTPFITPRNEGRSDLPQYSFTNNNRVVVWHIGLAGQVMDFFEFRAKASYSQNYGTYEVPFPKPVEQFSGLFSVAAPLDILGGVTMTASTAIDLGELYDKNVGFFISVRKDGQTSRRR